MVDNSGNSNRSALCGQIYGIHEASSQVDPQCQADGNIQRWSQQKPLLSESSREDQSSSNFQAEAQGWGKHGGEGRVGRTLDRRYQYGPLLQVPESHGNAFDENRRYFTGGYGIAGRGGETYAMGRDSSIISIEPDRSHRWDPPKAPPWEENARRRDDRQEMRSWADEKGVIRSTMKGNHVGHRDSWGNGGERRDKLAEIYGAEGGYQGVGLDPTRQEICDVRAPNSYFDSVRQRGEGGVYPDRRSQQWGQAPIVHHVQGHESAGFVQTLAGTSPRMVPARLSTRTSTMHNPIDSEELMRIKAKKDAYRRDLEAQVSTRKRAYPEGISKMRAHGYFRKKKRGWMRGGEGQGGSPTWIGNRHERG